jgi:hypothetical protein
MKLPFSIFPILLTVVSGIALESTPIIPPGDFPKLHAMFKTQPGESQFWDLPWMIQLDQALEKGAREGKPLFVWCGAGGAPVGVC